MQIFTRVVMSIETGEILHKEVVDYSGPVARCDRALKDQAMDASKQAQTAGKVAGGEAADYGAKAGALQATLVPTLEGDVQSAPGYGTLGLSDMETASEQSSASASGASAQRDRLRSMRTGNAAGADSTEAAIAGETARAGGSAVQDILAKNAMLKSGQRENAITGLEGVLGENIKAQGQEAGLVPENDTASANAVNAGAAAGKVGWLQNVLSTITALSNARGK